MKYMKQAAMVGTLALVAAGTAAAQTTTVDVTAAKDAFNQVKTAVGEIGPLMLLAAGAGIVFKWVTAFLI